MRISVNYILCPISINFSQRVSWEQEFSDPTV